MFKKKTRAYKGLAEAYQSDADFKMLKGFDRYNWGWNTKPTYIPMKRNMDVITGYYGGYVLFGNEPNMIEPWGCPFHPQLAGQRVANIYDLQTVYMDHLVVGNVSHEGYEMEGWMWLHIFLWAYNMYAKRDYDGILGVHVYGYTADYCIEQLEKMFSVYDGKFWVTEYAILDANPIEFEKLTDYISNHPKVDRYYAFTNRTDNVEQFPYPVDLVKKFLWWYLPTRLGWVYRKYPAEPNIYD